MSHESGHEINRADTIPRNACKLNNSCGGGDYWPFSPSSPEPVGSPDSIRALMWIRSPMARSFPTVVTGLRKMVRCCQSSRMLVTDPVSRSRLLRCVYTGNAAIAHAKNRETGLAALFVFLILIETPSEFQCKVSTRFVDRVFLQFDFCDWRSCSHARSIRAKIPGCSPAGSESRLLGGTQCFSRINK